MTELETYCKEVLSLSDMLAISAEALTQTCSSSRSGEQRYLWNVS